ncbi:MAG TPA: hypothetical protein VFJ81_08015 [Gemmatimonadales bacterium]|nr:hypothetical protein [Gemmatimonadales bacterium]
MTIAEKLREALDSTTWEPRDAAVVELAVKYAAQLDELFVRLGEDEAVESATHHKRVITEIDIIGRRLEAVLDRLGMSPASRPVVRNGGEGTGGDADSAALDGLRADAAAGAAGVDYASALDPAVAAAHS